MTIQLPHHIIFSTLIAFGLSMVAMESYAAPTSNVITAQHADLKKLNILWKDYQTALNGMEKALTSLKTEFDDQNKNVKIAKYTHQLEQFKNALNRLVLVQPQANQLRQKMLEHATKYQSSYKLSALSKPSSTQINMFERLNAQTAVLYLQMQEAAKKII